MRAPTIILIGLMFWAQMAWAEAPEGYILGAWAVEQYQDCASDWDRKTPRAKTATDYAHPGAPIGAVITGIRGSGPERKRFARFTECYVGALQKRLAENEREAELRNVQLREMCAVHRCDSTEWKAMCQSTMPDDFPAINCPN